MAKKTQAQINRALSQLRRVVENNKEDAVARRVAYEIEHAIRWATEDTVGWPTPLQSARGGASLIRSDLS